MTPDAMKDLIVLVPDMDVEFVLRALLLRPTFLGIRRLAFDVFSHPLHDPACAKKAPDFLRGFIRQYAYALVCFDHEGSGSTLPAARLEEAVRDHLSRNGWADRCDVVVFEPELESWLLIDSPVVPRSLGWPQHFGSLKEWLIGQGFWEAGEHKSKRPKEGIMAVLRETRTPRSSSLYAEIASQARPDRCEDRHFTKLRGTLVKWFGPK